MGFSKARLEKVQGLSRIASLEGNGKPAQSHFFSPISLLAFGFPTKLDNLSSKGGYQSVGTDLLTAMETVGGLFRDIVTTFGTLHRRSQARIAIPPLWSFAKVSQI